MQHTSVSGPCKIETNVYSACVMVAGAIVPFLRHVSLTEQSVSHADLSRQKKWEISTSGGNGTLFNPLCIPDSESRLLTVLIYSHAIR